MKVTKYPQSCLVIEKDGKRLLIDPGSFVAEKFTVAELGPVDAILITHEHPDHAHPELIKSVVGNSGVPVVANAGTKNTLSDLVTQVVKDGEEFEAGGFKVLARELPHMLLPDGSAGPQNTGYIIEGTFFHPGDGLEITGVNVPTSGVAVSGPDVSAKDVVSFVQSVGAKTIIPLHYHHPFFPRDPEYVRNLLGGVLPNVKVLLLGDGESADI
jgi:L-ascorbate metabolism protein UlaG (beta-lactamase superfamily)